MDVYDFGTDSDSSDNSESVFGGFDPADITRASHAQLAINRRQLSSISSASSSSSESERESDSNDTDNSVHNPIDLRADPPEWSTDLVPIQVPPFTSQSGPNLPNNWDKLFFDNLYNSLSLIQSLQERWHMGPQA